MRISSYTALALLAGVAAVLSVSSARAADLQEYSVAPPTAYPDAGLAVATDDWTGFYAGAHGMGATSNDFTEINSAFGGGIQAGYLQQFDMFVVGAEVEGSISDELLYELTPAAGLTEKWSVAAKARAGVALGSTLAYGVAGVSMAELTPAGLTTSPAESHAGIVFGAGIEQALGQNFSIRAEYLQTRYLDIESAVAGVGRTDDLTNHAVKMGVNYRF